jgi:catechol 2,3-dioxygenase-like lactoylglutathione lyase family enzyme
MQPTGVLETCLYAADLDAAERFYAGVLGLAVISREPGRHVFFRCGSGVFLVFNPVHTGTEQTAVGGAEIPLHGAQGAGHVAFRIDAHTLPAWRARLQQAGVAIESEVRWPGGGESLYFRDPGGNSIELAAPEIWGLT